MPEIGPLELGIVAVIILLLFGPGKAAELGSSLGKSIREFRKATREDDAAAPQQNALSAPGASGSGEQAASGQPEPAKERFCVGCGIPVRDRQKFCVSCGTAVTSWI